MVVPKPNMAAAAGAHALHNCKVFVSAAPPISFNFVSFYTAKGALELGAGPPSNPIQSGIPVRMQSLSRSLSGCATKAQSYLPVTFLCQ